ncbi:MAG: murein biosynthesis integral membrane protein MurJ [Bdellovibrionota bacterium]
MGIGKHASKVSSAIFGSRILGLVRDQIFAALMGAGFMADAYIIAFRIPNLLRDLFAEGSLTNAFVPTLTEYRVQQSDEKAWEFVGLTFGWILLLVGGLTLAGMVFAPEVVRWIAPGFQDIEGKFELTVTLARIMFPFFVFVSVASVLMGIHNTDNQFALPALAPMVFNIVSIACGVLVWKLGLEGNASVIGWSVGTLCGGLGQCLIQLPPLLRKGYRIGPRFRGMFSHPGIKSMAVLMLPSLVAVSGTQVNVLVNSILASFLEQGAPSWLNYAFRLMQLPLGVFGVAISMVTLATVSQDVAHKQDGHVGKTLESSILITLFLTLPSAFGLWALGYPIIELIYERGAFGAQDTCRHGHGLADVCPGTSDVCPGKGFGSDFFSFKDPKKPMIASLSGIGFNIAFNLWAYKHLGHSGLALGTSLGMGLNFLLLLYFVSKRNLQMPTFTITLGLSKMILSSAVMAWVARSTYEMMAHPEVGSLLGKISRTLIPVGVGLAVYLGMSLILKVPQATQVMNVLMRRFRRSD